MKLYNAQAPNPRRVRLFLAEKNVEIPRVDMELTRGDARSPEFLAKNSLGCVPVLELDDGTIITESVAICRYIESLHPEPPLFGTDALDQAKVEMWNRRMELELMMPLGHIAEHTFPFFAERLTQVPAYAEAERGTAAKAWRWLDGELADGRRFVAGDRFSIADITGMVASKFTEFVEVGIPDDCRNVRRWNETVRARPSWDA